MNFEFIITSFIGLMPVVMFLVALIYFDSYKLVKLNSVVSVIICGCVASGICYFLNSWLLKELGVELKTYTHYISPIVEELVKALFIIYLIHRGRIGFLVDATIFGFAIGTGFALVENFYYLQLLESNISLWIVRGFGTAIMHGGTTAIFAISLQALTDQKRKINPIFYLPGLVSAIVLHGVYNQFFLNPIVSTALILLLLPPFLSFVFLRSSEHLKDWLALDFDAHTQLIEDINSGEFSNTKVGKYLMDLRSTYQGPIIVDMLCYLRIYTELAIRAKGVLMMRENGFEMPPGERTRDKFVELKFLEKSLGKSGCLVMRPFLQMSHTDLWQLNMLDNNIPRSASKSSNSR